MQLIYYTITYTTDKGKTIHSFVNEVDAKECLHRLISKFIDKKENIIITFTETYQGRIMETYSVEVYK